MMWLAPFIFASAVLTIVGTYRRSKGLHYVFKPLTTILILAVALLAPTPVTPEYQALIVVGLMFSLAGDVFLMLPSDKFVAGLVSFLLGHLCYIAAFALHAGGEPALLGLVGFAAYAGVLLRVLLPHSGDLKRPVVVYAFVLSAMGWQAAAQWMTHGDTRSLLALAGAVLFLLSDSILALNRFVRPFPTAQASLLVTYYLAQWLIASSV